MKCAVFPGTFDPVTLGHMDLIKRASAVFDRLVVGILNNSMKNCMIPADDRKKLLEELTSDMDNVSVDMSEGLLADLVKKHDASVIVRGLRNGTDLDYEMPLAYGNHLLYNRAETVFIPAAPEFSFVSSSAVRELLRYDADISRYVPEAVIKYIKENEAGQSL